MLGKMKDCTTLSIKFKLKVGAGNLCLLQLLLG